MGKTSVREELARLKRHADRRTIVSLENDAVVLCTVSFGFVIHTIAAAFLFSPLWWFVVVPCALFFALMSRDLWIYAARAMAQRDLQTAYAEEKEAGA